MIGNEVESSGVVPEGELLADPRRAVRMKDIADRGGVSLATVSRVLRGAGAERFSKETRARVHQAAKELGWSPNRLVQGIQTGRTDTVGLLAVPFGSYWQSLMGGMHDELLKEGIVPLALYPRYNRTGAKPETTELAHLKQMMERRVDGICCWPVLDPEAMEYLVTVCAAQVPVVAIDFEPPLIGEGAKSIIVIRTREAMAMAAAADHLIELGHTRIGYVGRATPDAWAVNRRNAFVHHLVSRKISPAFIEEIDKDDPAALPRLVSDLRTATAVVAGSEQLSLGVWHVARENGLVVPRDLSIVGFGQLVFEFALWPTFTRIDQRPGDIGRLAAGLLTSAEKRAALLSPYVDVDPTLLQGDTTAPAPSR